MLKARLYFATIAALTLAGYCWGSWSHRAGWREGREALITEQAEVSEKLRRENTQRQQVEDVKAVEAERQGEAKTVTITKEVIKYIQRPDKRVCLFENERVSLKTEAVSNANKIAGFDPD